MDTTKLKKIAQFARRALIEQVAAKLEAVRAEGSAAQREHPAVFKKLEGSIAQHGDDEVIARVAYIWFNRFTALRFLDVNELSAIRVVSPLPGQFQPEILADAKAGNINEKLVPEATRQKVRDLLEGRTPSQDPQAEAYRLLLVAICNSWQITMPFLFERIDDYTELLLPADLLSNASILAYLREAMTPEACEDVEIIGWLYQFYISEKKDQVFAGLKKNQKITAENIPAATQLFTPHWIVRYLVENSLGRLWLLNNPQSGLAAKMDYYIAPEEPETDFLRITRPEEIRICDPAAGSGHMLTYAFDLLYAIYEEEGYDATEIPALILTHNLTGVEIDDRAGALAAFALAMKAAGKLGRRRFLRMEAKPDICVLQNVAFTEAEMQDVAAVVGKDLFTDELRETLLQFEQAKNFGSLIVPKLRDPAESLRVVEARDFGGDLLLKEVQERVIAVLRMAEALSPKYHVVVANPPYAGSKGLNDRMNAFLEKNFRDSKFDLMTAFMDRSAALLRASGYYGMINFPSWMFLTSFEKMREALLKTKRILSLAHLGRGMFGSDFGSVAFVVGNAKPAGGAKGYYRRLFEQHVDVRKPETIRSLFLDKAYNAFRVDQTELLAIPGSPVAYWISPALRAAFQKSKLFDVVAKPRKGITTSDNERFLRLWQEVEGIHFSGVNAVEQNTKWRPVNKGGQFRRWFGNREVIINWKSDGKEIKEFDRSVIRNPDYYFREGLTWNDITSGTFAMRFSPADSMFEGKGPMAFADNRDEAVAFAAFFNTKVCRSLLAFLAPTINFNIGDVARVPILPDVTQNEEAIHNGHQCIALARNDWDAYETSWDFTTLPLLSPDHRADTLEATYTCLRAHWQAMTNEMKALEEENNRIFIDAYGLADELTPEVPIEEITLTCNPAYRYGVKGTEGERETRLRADTMAEFLSYAVGCMFGRYSLDEPGLILANQGETLQDYLARILEPSFMPDEDNVIPVLDDNWFPDDITERFRVFLRVTFGEAHFRENLKFIEDALGKDIRKYFTKDFYADHVKRYKKRPIYWMVSSPKGTFNALIYMHRYRADTISVLLNDYLREFTRKLEAEKARLDKLSDDPATTQSQKTKAFKEAEKLAKQIDELVEWEREVIFPLAQQKIDIDLDDGVKANYPKFDAALKKVNGLS